MIGRLSYAINSVFIVENTKEDFGCGPKKNRQVKDQLATPFVIGKKKKHKHKHRTKQTEAIRRLFKQYNALSSSPVRH